MELGDVLAQGGVILLDEVPAHFIFRVTGVGRGLVGGMGCVVGRGVVGRSSAVLLLVDAGSVCGHLVYCASSRRLVGLTPFALDTINFVYLIV